LSSFERLQEQGKKNSFTKKRIVSYDDSFSISYKNKKLVGQCNEEVWATKAKAWIAAKSVTGNHQIEQHAISTSRTESHHNGYHDQYRQPAGLPTEVTEHLHPPVPQSSNDHVPFPMTGQHRETNHLLGTVSYRPCSVCVTFGCVSFRMELKIILQIEVQWCLQHRLLVHFHPPMSRRYLIIILLLQVCIAWEFNLSVQRE